MSSILVEKFSSWVPLFCRCANMLMVKIKIFYGEDFDQCQNIHIAKTWLDLMNYKAFTSTILEVVGTFFKEESPSDVRMQY